MMHAKHFARSVQPGEICYQPARFDEDMQQIGFANMAQPRAMRYQNV